MMIFHYQLEMYHKWSTKMLVEQMVLPKNGSVNNFFYIITTPYRQYTYYTYRVYKQVNIRYVLYSI